MKTLVAYYSRTGITKTVAEEIAKSLGADIEEIIDLKDRGGSLGFVVSCKDAAMKKASDIKPQEKDPGAYDLVILGTPVWAGTMSCGIRAYIKNNKDALKKLAFFCTTQSSGISSCLEHMERESGQKPVAALALKTKEVKKREFLDQVKQFADAILKKESE